MIGTYTDGDLVKIESHTIHFADMRLVFRDEGKMKLLLAGLTEFFAPKDEERKCEFCDEPATTTEKDELGNDCAVCENHAQMLAAKKPERRADEHHDQEKS